MCRHLAELVIFLRKYLIELASGIIPASTSKAEMKMKCAEAPEIFSSVSLLFVLDIF